MYLLTNRGYAITCPHMTTIYNGMFKICRTKTKAQFNHLLVLRLVRFDPNRYTTIKTGTTVNRHVAGKVSAAILFQVGRAQNCFCGTQEQIRNEMMANSLKYI